jgi:hypothetical protein
MKVKSSLVGNEQPTNQIDWGKPQLLLFNLSNEENIWIIQSNGKHGHGKFEGMVVWAHPNASVKVGDIETTWTKTSYSPLSPNQQVILQNSND